MPQPRDTSGLLRERGSRGSLWRRALCPPQPPSNRLVATSATAAFIPTPHLRRPHRDWQAGRIMPAKVGAMPPKSPAARSGTFYTKTGSTKTGGPAGVPPVGARVGSPAREATSHSHTRPSPRHPGQQKARCSSCKGTSRTPPPAASAVTVARMASVRAVCEMRRGHVTFARRFGSIGALTRDPTCSRRLPRRPP